MSTGTALLVIDVQICNFDESAPVYKGKELLLAVGDLLAWARAAMVPIIYVQHCGSEGAIDQPGTVGWDIHPTIAPVEGDVIVWKHYPDAFQDTNLQRELEARGVGRLVVAGIQTEYCIDTTCRRAYSLGYDVTLAADAHSTWDTDRLAASQVIAHHNEVLGGWFVELKNVNDIHAEST